MAEKREHVCHNFLIQSNVMTSNVLFCPTSPQLKHVSSLLNQLIFTFEELKPEIGYCNLKVTSDSEQWSFLDKKFVELE